MNALVVALFALVALIFLVALRTRTDVATPSVGALQDHLYRQAEREARLRVLARRHREMP